MIERTSYKGKEAVTLCSDEASFTFLTERGSTMVSAKRHGREFLVQRPGAVFTAVPFDGQYTKAI